MLPLIRPFKPDDYSAIAVVLNAALPGNATTPEEMRLLDEQVNPKCKHQRWVAEVNARVVAFAEYEQRLSSYHPRKFFLYIDVHPDYQRQGIGSALYARLMEVLQPFDPILVRAEARENLPHGVRFLIQRGFQEDERNWESYLDVAAFDPTPYAGLEEQLYRQGIEIKTLQELANTDPGCDRKLYELEDEAARDVPSEEAYTPWDYDYFVNTCLHGPGIVPDAYFIAVCNGEYVGKSSFWLNRETTNYLVADMTGVKRAYRRRHIALALKLRSIAYARSHGYASIHTANDSRNQGMLALNERLGFARQYALITFSKVLGQ